jgi:ribonuclease P protein subunit POP4
MWCSYIAELLNLSPKPLDPSSGIEGSKPELKIPPSMPMQSKLVKAEFHGAIIEGNVMSPGTRGNYFSGLLPRTVTQSKNKSLVGCKGIVVHETENTFKIVTSRDLLKGAQLRPCLTASYLTRVFSTS